MQWAVIILIVSVCWTGLAEGLPAPHCTPAAMEEDPRVARVCSALNTFLELYAEASEKAGPNAELQAALFREYPELLNIGMKRQDVVHNFLRFGRRR